MKIVLAPDSYKGCLTAVQVCNALETGIRRFLPEAEIVKVPMADGGEGTVQSLVDASDGRIVDVTVYDPLGRKIKSFFGIMGGGKTAVIEMAAASGLPLLRMGERSPRTASTRGTGDLINAALNEGCTRIIMGIGGSATNDGGRGMAEALGARFLDKEGKPLSSPGGGALADLDRIDISGLDSRVARTEFVVACDVDNPLTGPRGASAVYGPQKGATPADVEFLDAALANYARAVKEQLGLDVNDMPGAGAAGGLGAGLVAFCNAKLRRGAEIVVDATRLVEKCFGADLVITGEGRTDFQTKFGKTPMGVAKAAKLHDIPVILISGALATGARDMYGVGVDALFAIPNAPITLETSLKEAPSLLADAAENVVRTFVSARGVK
ncbi:MAG TPA: glycerate kinase [Bacillota bacterium]|nr:MAG: Glycerate kinase [Firmicutes bacterium ADurb.Bin153]HNV34934.1 glycerate kinase [Bacillota bacterium]HPU95635.1 glycerate kinase [Bacillota bacterium]